MQALREGVGQKLWSFTDGSARCLQPRRCQLHGRQRNICLCCRMFRKVVGGITGTIVVYRAMIIVVMMSGTSQVVDLMRNIESACRRIPAAFHGNAMQGQEQHQQDTKKAAHVLDSKSPGRLHEPGISCQPYLSAENCRRQRRHWRTSHSNQSSPLPLQLRTLSKPTQTCDTRRQLRIAWSSLLDMSESCMQAD